MGIAGLAIGAGALWAAKASPILEETPTERVERFTEQDYSSFDRNFDYEGRTCEVGLRRNGICFSRSPAEAALGAGDIVPAQLPAMPAEFPVIVKTALKADGLETWRYGRSLYLVRSGNREIVDVMHLDTPWQGQTDGPAVMAAMDPMAQLR